MSTRHTYQLKFNSVLNPAVRSQPLLSVYVSCSFIYERVQRHGDSKTTVTRAQLGGGELCDPNHKKLAMCLQQIGDELDGNVELQR